MMDIYHFQSKVLTRSTIWHHRHSTETLATTFFIVERLVPLRIKAQTFYVHNRNFDICMTCSSLSMIDGFVMAHQSCFDFFYFSTYTIFSPSHTKALNFGQKKEVDARYQAPDKFTTKDGDFEYRSTTACSRSQITRQGPSFPFSRSQNELKNIIYKYVLSTRVAHIP